MAALLAVFTIDTRMQTNMIRVWPRWANSTTVRLRVLKRQHPKYTLPHRDATSLMANFEKKKNTLFKRSKNKGYDRRRWKGRARVPGDTSVGAATYFKKNQYLRVRLQTGHVAQLVWHFTASSPKANTKLFKFVQNTPFKQIPLFKMCY